MAGRPGAGTSGRPWTTLPYLEAKVIVDLIFSYPGEIAPYPCLPFRRARSRAGAASRRPPDVLADRFGRLAALSHQDTVAGLLWLAMNFPAVCDAMLGKAEDDAIDDEDSQCEEPEPYCTACGAAAGIFAAYGREWLHFQWDYAPGSRPEVFDAGHEAQISWRPARHSESAVAY